MKKLLLAAMFLIWGGNYAFGTTNEIPMQIIDETPAGNIHPYAPPRPWYIMQDDYVLTLPAFDYDYTLVLFDEEGVVVFSADYSAGTTTVTLPSTLSGEFELRLVPYAATYYYRGYMEL